MRRGFRNGPLLRRPAPEPWCLDGSPPQGPSGLPPSPAIRYSLAKRSLPRRVPRQQWENPQLPVGSNTQPDVFVRPRLRVAARFAVVRAFAALDAAALALATDALRASSASDALSCNAASSRVTPSVCSAAVGWTTSSPSIFAWTSASKASRYRSG